MRGGSKTESGSPQSMPFEFAVSYALEKCARRLPTFSPSSTRHQEGLFQREKSRHVCLSSFHPSPKAPRREKENTSACLVFMEPLWLIGAAALFSKCSPTAWLTRFQISLLWVNIKLMTLLLAEPTLFFFVKAETVLCVPIVYHFSSFLKDHCLALVTLANSVHVVRCSLLSSECRNSYRGTVWVAPWPTRLLSLPAPLFIQFQCPRSLFHTEDQSKTES